MWSTGEKERAPEGEREREATQTLRDLKRPPASHMCWEKKVFTQVVAGWPRLLPYGGGVNAERKCTETRPRTFLANGPDEQQVTSSAFAHSVQKECLLWKLLLGQTAEGQQSAGQLEGEGIYRGVGGGLFVLLSVGGKEPSGARGQRSAARTQQLS